MIWLWLIGFLVCGGLLWALGLEIVRVWELLDEYQYEKEENEDEDLF